MVWLLGAHHVASSKELDIFIGHLSFAMQRVGLAYVFYLAIEPYARRLWPRMLVSWVRVLEGRFRDPLVGRDLLVGCAGGALIALLQRLQILISGVFGGAAALPAWTDWSFEPLRGTLHAFVAIAAIHTVQLLNIIFPMTLLLILRLLLRRTGLAIAAVSLLAMVMYYPESGSVPGYIIATSLALAIFWLLLFRVGLLAFAAMNCIGALLGEMPLTPHPAGWYLGGMLLAIAFIVAPAFYGFWTSQAGRPLFRDEILEPAAGR
jgi:serine/threonine-protein kinase